MRKVFVLTFIIALVASVGVVSAQWLADGSGEGRAVAGTATGVTITPGVPITPLFPGGNGDVALTINNNNDFDVTITELEVDGPVISTDPACEAAGHEVTAQGAVGSWLVPANDSIDVLLEDAASMGTNASNECQEVEFLVPFVVS